MRNQTHGRVTAVASPVDDAASAAEQPDAGFQESLISFFENLADVAPVRTGRAAAAASLLVLALLLLTAFIVYLTNGTEQPFLHLVYLPVIIASLALGLAGGLLTALIGGLVVLGPLMPLDVAAGLQQAVPSVLYRTLFLVLIAVMTGAFGESIRRRRHNSEQARARLQRLYSRNLRLFATLVSERDRETADHCERVANNCVVIGRALGMSRSDLLTLYWSGMLHDLGKLGVPEAILQKPAALTDEEFEVVKKHSNIGADFLISLSTAFEPIAQGVRWHHERWDGTGYPDGLAGEDIPLSARILAVADVFEAVSSERPYHHALELADAVAIIRSGSGSHFDPAIVAVFEDLVRNGQLLSQEAPVGSAYDSFAVELNQL